MPTYNLVFVLGTLRSYLDLNHAWVGCVQDSFPYQKKGGNDEA
ncbi:MAG: hypothetical protein AB4426_10655 [Xenococcaceae cyanobacterium]